MKNESSRPLCLSVQPLSAHMTRHVICSTTTAAAHSLALHYTPTTHSCEWSTQHEYVRTDTRKPSVQTYAFFYTINKDPTVTIKINEFCVALLMNISSS